MKTVLFLSIQALLFSFAGSAQGTTVPPRPAEPLGWGKVANGQFSSPRLGLKISIPENFTLISSAEAQLLGSAGADVLKQGNSNKRIDEALNRTIQLLAISEHPVGTLNNAALEIVAVKQQVGVTAKMSLTANVMLLKGTPFVLKSARGPVRLGANSFETANLEGEFSGVFLKQRMYVIIQKGYSIMIAVTYRSDEQISAMEKVIATLSLAR